MWANGWGDFVNIDDTRLATINVTNSTLSSSGDGIVVEGGTTDLTFTGVTLTNGSTVMMRVDPSGAVLAFNRSDNLT